MPASIRPGDVLADRYRLVDLLTESDGGRFWRAHDRVLERHVAIHVIAADDPRAEPLLEAARRSATILDPHILRVLDAERSAGLCYVVNEWGQGTSLDIMLSAGGELSPRRAAWVAGQVAAACQVAHASGVAHGRLVPENVLVDTSGAVRVIGWSVDAALHGRTGGRVQDDVADLAGVLYAALTGRWAGPTPSAVPRAPVDHGRVLRPRQVRAGIPRDLDTLCDEVLNDGRHTAADVRRVLEDFVGDPVGLQESMVSRLVTPDQGTVVLPQVPEFAVREEPRAESAPEGQPAAPVDRSDDPPTGDVTQAEIPGFLAGDPDASPSTPPPPFEEPPARPLFAPDPPDGAPVRRPRHPSVGTGATDSATYWPWATGTDHGAVDTGWPTGAGPVVEEEDVPGRNTFRLAALLLAAMLLLVAVVVAFNLGRGRTPLGGEPDPEPSASSSQRAQPARPLEVAAATDLDPQGTDGGENPELVPLVVDGDAATTWRTATYEQQLGPAGLKTGVGLVLDLGSAQEVSALDLRLVGEPTAVSVYVTGTAPTASPTDDLDPVAQVQAGTQERVELDEPATGRFVTLWFTALPAVPDGFRAELAEVTVRG